MARDLKGKVALVTGGSRGLGAGIARSLARAGAKVAVNYHASGELARAIVEGIDAQGGGEAAAFKADVTDEAAVALLADEVTRTFGPIDILVLNATGPQPFIPVEKIRWRDCLDQLDFFVKSPYLLLQQVVGPMKERRFGRIIHIGSEVFETALPNEFSQYIAAKGAQLGLTRAWAQELGPWQITVNLVAPGWVPVERHADAPPEAKEAYAATLPLRRQGVPEDVGEAVAFLASDEANFITGQKVSVNGGNSFA